MLYKSRQWCKAIKSKSVMEIKTLLNTISIVLQNGKKRNQDNLSKQNASTTPLFIKGIKPPGLSQWV